MRGLPAMQAGRLDRRIAIERAGYITNDFGESVPGWSVLAKVWASISHGSAGERFSAQEVAAERTTKFTVRYSDKIADVNPKDRVCFDGRRYNVVAVAEIRRREGFEITAAARAD